MAFSRGPDWPEQRRKALDRDGYACRWCGATDAPGRTLQVHHIRPYSTFGEPFVEARSANANELSNLVTLCPSCHRLAEQSVAVRGSLAGFGYAVRHLLPTILLCDPGDVGVLTDPHSSQTGEATLFIYDDLPGGVGLSRQAMKQFDELVTKVSTLIASCPCAHGCPSCIGPVLDGDAPAKVRVGALAARLAEAAATSGKQ